MEGATAAQDTPQDPVARGSADLAKYRQEALDDPVALVIHARRMESRREFEDALLAWERILDSTPGAEKHMLGEALEAARRLRDETRPPDDGRPPGIVIVLHAETARGNAAALGPVIDEVSRDLERESHGIVSIRTLVREGTGEFDDGRQPPVALWFTGPDNRSRSSGLMSVIPGSAETLRGDILRTVCRMVRTTCDAPVPVHALDSGGLAGNPVDSAGKGITRLLWRKFALLLNQPAD